MFDDSNSEQEIHTYASQYNGKSENSSISEVIERTENKNLKLSVYFQIYTMIFHIGQMMIEYFFLYSIVSHDKNCKFSCYNIEIKILLCVQSLDLIVDLKVIQKDFKNYCYERWQQCYRCKRIDEENIYYIKYFLCCIFCFCGKLMLQKF